MEIKLIEALKWSFGWNAEGWVLTNSRVRNSWEVKSYRTPYIPCRNFPFPSGIPPDKEDWRKSLLWLLQGEGKSKPYEICPEFSQKEWPTLQDERIYQSLIQEPWGRTLFSFQPLLYLLFQLRERAVISMLWAELQPLKIFRKS